MIDSSNQLDGKYVANWINVDLNAISNAQKDDELEKMKISPENFGKLIALVKENKIIAEGNNQVTNLNDPTAHAEIVAIRNACKSINDFNLKGTEIYTSLSLIHI